MRLIIAAIPVDKLDDVRKALLAIDVGHMTVARATGHGRFSRRASEDTALYRGVEHVPDLSPMARVEIAALREHVDATIEAISRACSQSSGREQGIIFVLPIEACVRVPSGERGREALGDPT